jgi:hypothetical protein
MQMPRLVEFCSAMIFMKKEPVTPDMESTRPLSTAGFSTQTLAELRKLGITTRPQVKAITDDQMANLSDKAQKEVRKVIA